MHSSNTDISAMSLYFSTLSQEVRKDLAAFYLSIFQEVLWLGYITQHAMNLTLHPLRLGIITERTQMFKNTFPKLSRFQSIYPLIVTSQTCFLKSQPYLIGIAVSLLV